MPSLYTLIRLAPASAEQKAEWRRSLLDRAYAKDIAAARKAGNVAKVEELERGHMFELQLEEEDEDARLTRYLIRKAKRLHVPTPRLTDDGGAPSDRWYEAPLTSRRLLTTKGVSQLRDELRKEQRARHESRTVWLPWLSAATGLVGTATGLVAVLYKP